VLSKSISLIIILCVLFGDLHYTEHTTIDDSQRPSLFSIIGERVKAPIIIISAVVSSSWQVRSRQQTQQLRRPIEREGFGIDKSTNKTERSVVRPGPGSKQSEREREREREDRADQSVLDDVYPSSVVSLLVKGKKSLLVNTIVSLGKSHQQLGS